MGQFRFVAPGGLLRRFRFLTAAVLASAVAVSTGCMATPPPVSQKVQDYYDANKDRALGQSTAASTAPAITPVAFGFDIPSIKTAVATNPTVTISVLGDSTGDARGEWVDLWGKHLAATASVTVHFWDQRTEDWSPTTAFYPGAAGRSIEIWNGSQGGAMADYPATRLKVMQPAKPDFMILSFGHNGPTSAISPTLLATSEAVTTQWGGKIPTVAVLQNAAGEPHTEQTNNNQTALQLWATNNGVPVIDVRAAFDAVPDITTVLKDDQTGVHPNDAGSQIWADTVTAALG